MYSFCRAFNCSPEEYDRTLAEDVDVLLAIHGEVKSYEADEHQRLSKT